MKTQRKILSAYVAIALFALPICAMSCLYTRHDIHITLDIRHVKETATSIEDVVSGEKDLKDLEAKQGAMIGDLPWPLAFLRSLDPTAGAMAAGEFEIREVNDTLRKAIAGRQARFEDFTRYKAEGLVGEANNAELTVRPSLKDKDKDLVEKVTRMVQEENADRVTIYREVARQNKAEDTESMAKIRQAWAAVHREKSRKGDWVQAPDTKEFYGKFLEEPIARKLGEKPRPGAWFQTP